MPTEIEKLRDLVLKHLYEKASKAQSEDEYWCTGNGIQQETDLTPNQINDAVEILENYGLAERLSGYGTVPYHFFRVKITARGKYEYERKKSAEEAIPPSSVHPRESELLGLLTRGRTIKPPLPVGSPYGFTGQDWEVVSRRKADKDVLYVTLGCKFESQHYDTDELKKNVKSMFDSAVQRYCRENPGELIKLEFIALHAGYGEHLFNAIARDIISSDISVFETSDLAPNVFIEAGVALTWGSRVFLIKEKSCPSPPSDISGHTYVDYTDSAAAFEDSDHAEKLYRMVEHAIRKKG